MKKGLHAHEVARRLDALVGRFREELAPEFQKAFHLQRLRKQLCDNTDFAGSLRPAAVKAYDHCMNRAKYVAVALVLAGLASCSSGDADTSGTSAESPAGAAVTVPSGQQYEGDSPVVTAQALAEVVCRDSPTRMGGESEMYTQESWTCSRRGEQVRIDLYADAAQKDRAEEVVLEFYASAGDDRPLSELPLACGDTWVVGVDFNDTRDVVIGELDAAGYDASTC